MISIGSTRNDIVQMEGENEKGLDCRRTRMLAAYDKPADFTRMRNIEALIATVNS